MKVKEDLELVDLENMVEYQKERLDIARERLLYAAKDVEIITEELGEAEENRLQYLKEHGER